MSRDGHGERPKAWRVGELARQTGVSVRTLHYYEEIGLLTPSRRSSAGHRLYVDSDVIRLQQVLSLRQLGVALGDISAWLSSPDVSPLAVIEMQHRQLVDEIVEQQRLARRLRTVAAQLKAGQSIPIEQFLRIIEETNMIENYYTPEQLEALEERRQSVGEDRIREVQQEWQTLFEQFRAEMDKGTDPASEPVRALARRSRALIREFTGGDPGTASSLHTMYQNERPAMVKRWGIDSALADYMDRARAALADDD